MTKLFNKIISRDDNYKREDIRKVVDALGIIGICGKTSIVTVVIRLTCIVAIIYVISLTVCITIGIVRFNVGVTFRVIPLLVRSSRIIVRIISLIRVIGFIGHVVFRVIAFVRGVAIGIILFAVSIRVRIQAIV